MDYIPPYNITTEDDKSIIGAEEATIHSNPWLILHATVLMIMLVIGGGLTLKFIGQRSDLRIDVDISDNTKLSETTTSSMATATTENLTAANNLSQATITAPSRDNIVVQAKDRAIRLQTVTIKPKDNLGRIFKRFGLSTKHAADILKLKQAKPLRLMRVGRKLDLALDSSGAKLQELSYEVDSLTTLIVAPMDKGWQVKTKSVEPTINFKYVAANVDGSFYAAGKKVGVSNKHMAKLANVFGRKVNIKKIRRGSRLAVVYKEHTINGKRICDNEIAAAELVVDGKKHRVVSFADKHGHANFYTPDGRSIEPAFVRYPLKNFKRIGSRFSLNRLHPILGFRRPHVGVDFTADRGTPVYATSSGHIEYVGYHGGHGRTIKIKNGAYSTLYAHLSRYSKGVYAGADVKKGEVIGFVGSSGLASGPHLHYEVHVNGVPHDPLKVRLPDGGEMIKAQHRKQFFLLSKRMLAELELHGREYKVYALNAKISGLFIP